MGRIVTCRHPRSLRLVRDAGAKRQRRLEREGKPLHLRVSPDTLIYGLDPVSYENRLFDRYLSVRDPRTLDPSADLPVDMARTERMRRWLIGLSPKLMHREEGFFVLNGARPLYEPIRIREPLPAGPRDYLIGKRVGRIYAARIGLPKEDWDGAIGKDIVPFCLRTQGMGQDRPYFRIFLIGEINDLIRPG